MGEQLLRKRIESIDILRGLAMVIMALDHVRDYFHAGASTADPLDLATTTPWLFFTRWITHMCAPVFVFLSGTSIYLQAQRKTPRELGLFLVKRGAWLIIAEWTIIALAWTFNPFYNFIPFQVIWAIGISMVIIGLLVLAKTPYKMMLALGLIIVVGHNLLDIPENRPGFQTSFWWDLLHHGKFSAYEFSERRYAIIVYPFLAWTGLMLLGYATGVFFTNQVSVEARRRFLVRLGAALIVFFVLLRWSNVYGDPNDWIKQKNFGYTFLSFIKVNKYPPSLLYLCIMIGPSLLMLAWMESWQNRFSRVMVIFGRTAFFYYIIHLYVIHLLAAIMFFVRGHEASEIEKYANQSPFLMVVPGEGFGLPGVYLVWLTVLIILYPLCRAYNRYKSAHPEKWWLSYL